MKVMLTTLVDIEEENEESDHQLQRQAQEYTKKDELDD